MTAPLPPSSAIAATLPSGNLRSDDANAAAVTSTVSDLTPTVSYSSGFHIAAATTTTTATSLHGSDLSSQTTDDATTQQAPPPPPPLIMFSAPSESGEWTAPEDNFRAVHRIRLSALQHNFSIVEGAANRQRCNVITVVKADGYGHGAIATALYLADSCGCDAFAVATLEEAIALRKALEHNPPGKWNKELASLFHTQTIVSALSTTTTTATTTTTTTNNTSSASATVSGSRSESPVLCEHMARIMRPARVRIIVLGPPVGFPRCFDDFYYHDIELMVSGPEVAKALVEWVLNETERKRIQVERAASDAKARALLATPLPRDSVTVSAVAASAQAQGLVTGTGRAVNGTGSEPQEASQQKKQQHQQPAPASKVKLPCSTLGNVSGQDLARELRTLLLNQSKAANEAAATQALPPLIPTRHTTIVSSANSENSSVSSDTKDKAGARPSGVPSAPPTAGTAFGGIEAAAKSSRHRELATARANEVFLEDAQSDATVVAPTAAKILPPTAAPMARKMLRWHAMVDSGMGRDGFRTDPVQKGETRQDTVEILKELVDMEIHGNAPIEFYGMCTHMAEANASSSFTAQQISKFVSLLKRVRAAGIFVPTLSTDNSMALLTNELNHFDPKEILSQSHADTRGYCRIGGAIFGQRPAFTQLKAVSTLLASVRHIAILKKGETVGYDRAYVAEHDVRIATLTIGFADGYPRELGNRRGRVAIRGCVFPVVGNVCMDMVMVELGRADDTEGVGATVAVRDTAVMWGPLDDEREGLVPLKDLAAELNTTQSALTCGLDKIRVRRQFI